jgi:transglutaminase-like putative cysteine protease
MRGSWQADGLDIDTLVRAPVQRTAPDASVVDEWLRSDRLRNSFRLPRALTAEEAGRPLVLGLRGARAEDLARAFPPTSRLRVEVTGPALARLRVLPASPPPVRPAPPTAAERALALASDGAAPAPALRAAAREVAGGRAPALEQARAIVAWVHQQMTYEITPAGVDDLTLLTRKRGDCTEFSQLTIALLRALGIPARMRSGFMAADLTLVAHAWVELHDGERWREVDPTAGRMNVDATYLDASVLDALALISLGQLEIVSVE